MPKGGRKVTLFVAVEDPDNLAPKCAGSFMASEDDTVLKHMQPHVDESKIDISELAFFIEDKKIEDVAADTIAKLVPHMRACTVTFERKVGPAMLGRLILASDEAGVRQLIQAGVKIDAGEVPALHYAATKTDTVMMRLLIAETEGTEVDYCLGTVGHPGNIALNVALRCGVCEELAVLLIERGGATLIKNTKVTTDELPVAVAAYLGWSKVVDLLLKSDRCGDLSKRWDRRTPLQWARAGQVEQVLSYSEAKQQQGRTHSTGGDYVETIKLLEAVESKGLEKRRRQREETNAETDTIMQSK